MDDITDMKEIRFKLAIPSLSDQRARPGRALVDVTGLPRIPEREYGRVVVLLGTNGSGKSRLLKTIASNPKINGELRKVVFVEGGRMLVLPESKSRNKQRPEYKQSDTLAQRAAELFTRLESERHTNDEAYKEEVVAWVEGAFDGARPTRKESAIHRLKDIFSQLLPRRELSLNSAKWSYTNNGVPCGFSMLSDGEKQSLCLIGDVGVLSHPRSLIVVDEPELNLHPGLAMNLWNWIEDNRPESVFFYATHSISFAMRSSVTDIVVLGEHDQEPMVLDRLSDSDGINWEPFLGAIPAFITTKRVLAVEGESDKAFDFDFYKWVLGPEITVVNVGSCHSVRAAVNHEGAWGKAGNAVICGLVDRDYLDDAKLEEFTKRDCLVLRFHEAESYLCHPDLIADTQPYSSTTRSREEIVDYLVTRCSGELLMATALERAAKRSENQMRIGKPRGESWPKDLPSAKLALERWIQSESPRAASFEAAVINEFDVQYNLCKAAIDNRNIDQLLAFFPGKELLKSIVTYAGFQNQSHFMKVVTQFLQPKNYQTLVEIAKAVRDKLP